MNGNDANGKSNIKKLGLLSIAALGVVYGDIGTSPLYAVNEIFFGHTHLPHDALNVFGAISIVFWAITIIVSFKYILFVLRADNDGEGGVFALYGLLHHLKNRSINLLLILLIIAAGLLFGDGMITPAISVISAVEGLKIATPFFAPYVVPITIIILTGLFLIQKSGTAKVGSLFGPIVIIWFISIGLIGLTNILKTPLIIQAINPVHALNFFMIHDIHKILLVLGSVMLVVTGGEAMYADMGHFGRKPIRISWFAVVYPALILNYLGQGALLLSGKEIIGNNIFYSMVPSWGLYPMVILATCATIIASQALISGAFSLTMQAIQLGLLPYIKIKHTHEEHRGQIYLPLINWSLYVGCVCLVLMFRSSSNLASAYGLAVSGVMLITSFGMMMVSRYFWKWSIAKTVLLWIPLALVDSTFLISNSLKIFSGGYIPLLIAIILLIFMRTWAWGRSHVAKAFKNISNLTIKDLVAIKKGNNLPSIPKSFVLLTKNPLDQGENSMSPMLQTFIDRYGILPKHLIILHVAIAEEPHMRKNRFEIQKFFEDEKKGSVVYVKANYGFMEDIEPELLLKDLADHDAINIDHDPSEWLLHVIHEKMIYPKIRSLSDKFKYLLYKIIQKNTWSSDHYFGLGKKNKLTIEVLPVFIK